MGGGVVVVVVVSAAVMDIWVDVKQPIASKKVTLRV